MAYSPARAETRGILLRGWFGEFSTGLDAIADALKAKGIRAEVAGHLQWKTAADEIRRERAQGKTDAIVVVGHSQGLTTSSTWLSGVGGAKCAGLRARGGFF